MSRWMIFALLLLASCAVLKEKSRLKRDSLSHISTSGQWELKQRWQHSGYLFKDSNSLQAILIKADAPFRWQADSGLTGKAGNYQLYLMHQGKSLTAMRQSARQDLTAEHSREKKELKKSVKIAKEVASSAAKNGLMLLLALILVVGLVFGLKRI